jgi:hypothetical protein
MQTDSLSSETLLALKAIQIANLLAQKQHKPISPILEEINNTLTAQKNSFRITWSFIGTKYYISTNVKLKRYREWLLTLFTALEGENRDAILDKFEKIKQNAPK